MGVIAGFLGSAAASPKATDWPLDDDAAMTGASREADLRWAGPCSYATLPARQTVSRGAVTPCSHRRGSASSMSEPSGALEVWPRTRLGYRTGRGRAHWQAADSCRRMFTFSGDGVDAASRIEGLCEEARVPFLLSAEVV